MAIVFGDEDDGDDYDKEAKSAEQRSEDPVELRSGRRPHPRRPATRPSRDRYALSRRARRPQLTQRPRRKLNLRDEVLDRVRGHGRARCGPRDEK